MTAAVGDIIQAGDYVAISGGATFGIFHLRKGAQSRFGKGPLVQLTSLVGHRYGDVYEIDEQSKALIPSAMNPELDGTTLGADQVAAEDKDNRTLVDTHGENQSLKDEDVLRLKEEVGVRGIVDQLVQGSATFASKTSFAQEKYVRRKRAKYSVVFKIERPSLDTICESLVPTRYIDPLESLDDQRWVRLRVDSLALMLHLSGVVGPSRALVYEQTNGFLCTAVMHRLGDNGMLFNVLVGAAKPMMEYAKSIGLANVKDRWRCVPYVSLVGDVVAEEEPTRVSTEASTASKGGAEGGGAERLQKSQWIAGAAVKADFAANPPNTLLIAAPPDDVVEKTMALFRFLDISASFTVFCPSVEPLYRLFVLLRSDCVLLKITDPFYREYQVLPGRTHPNVVMSGAGGFILSGVKVARRLSASDTSAPGTEAPVTKKIRLE